MKKLLGIVAVLLTLVGVGMAQEVIPSPSNILNGIVRGTLSFQSVAGVLQGIASSGANVLNIGQNGLATSLCINGSGTSAICATSGAIRLQQGGSLTSENTAGSGVANLIMLDGSDLVNVAGSGAFVLDTNGRIFRVGGVATARSSQALGNGIPLIAAIGRSTAQTAANANVVTYTVGAADTSFEVSANVLVTTSTTHTFTVTCAYTDEGNTARTVTLEFEHTGSFVASIASASATPYHGIPLHIRAKTGTTIVIATTGTFTTVTYNVEGIIKLTF